VLGFRAIAGKLGHTGEGPITAATGFSQSHVSRQLGQLQWAGLVSCVREGVRMIDSADNDLVNELCALVQTRLRQRLKSSSSSLSRPKSAPWLWFWASRFRP